MSQWLPYSDTVKHTYKSIIQLVNKKCDLIMILFNNVACILVPANYEVR